MIGGVQALDNVSLEVQQGQFLAIMGASGSGKSTMLHLMSALATPDSGRVLIDGNDLSKLGDRKINAISPATCGVWSFNRSISFPP